MAEYLAPGMYEEEIDSKIFTIEAVDTSIAGFIGMAERGNVVGKPQLICSISEFQKYFGGHLAEEYGIHRFLSYAVGQFFDNGGERCYVMRAIDSRDQTACTTIEGLLYVEAKNPGAWGNSIKVEFRKSIQAKTVIKEVNEVEGKVHNVVISTEGFYRGDIIESNGVQTIINDIIDNTIVVDNKLAGAESNVELYSVVFDINIFYDGFTESYEKCSLNKNAPTFIQTVNVKSDFVSIELVKKEGELSCEELLAFHKKHATNQFIYALEGGSSNIPNEDYTNIYIGQDNEFLKRTGLQAFLEIDDVSIMAIPGICDKSVQNALIHHCESTASRFAILDVPLSISSVDEVIAHCEGYTSSYAALYHPWLSIFDVLLKKNSFVPPSGTIAGIYARVDSTRGIWKAPANEIVRNVSELSVNYDEIEYGKLNPNRVNLIRVLPRIGIRVWNARTCSSDINYKYVNVRRLLIYIEECIKEKMKKIDILNNDSVLWSNLSESIRSFLTKLWRDGAFVGSNIGEAFFVNIGPSTMTQEDILNGRLICEIGVAPVRPSEYIIFRICQVIENEY